MSKVRFITEGPNKGVEVRIVGRNLEGDPIVQRIDEQPLEWPAGRRRHVLDMPEHMLSKTKPVPTLLEAAQAVIGAASHTWYFWASARPPAPCRLSLPVSRAEMTTNLVPTSALENLRAAVERERS